MYASLMQPCSQSLRNLISRPCVQLFGKEAGVKTQGKIKGRDKKTRDKNKPVIITSDKNPRYWNVLLLF